MLKKGIQLLSIIALSFVMVQLYAKPVRLVRDQRQFNEMLREYNFSVAIFYKDEMSDTLEDVVEDLADFEPYEDAGVRFLKVNVEEQELMALSKNYNITTIPSVGLFKRSEFVKQKSFDPNATQDDVRTFIDTNFGTDIGKILQEQAKKEKRYDDDDDDADRGSRGSTSFYFGLGGGWPYYGSYWPYYSGYYSGYPWYGGYRYPYYRRYYRGGCYGGRCYRRGHGSYYRHGGRRGGGRYYRGSGRHAGGRHGGFKGGRGGGMRGGRGGGRRR